MTNDVASITALTIQVSLGATIIATFVGLPLGVGLALAGPRTRAVCTPIVNAAMATPPVVLGLVLYLVLSHQGPLGEIGLLYSPTAMTIAQVLLVTPIVIGLTSNHAEAFLANSLDELRSLGSRGTHLISTVLYSNRFSLFTIVLAGAARAFSEVGAVLVVGGNIDGHTRVLTTSIAMETSRGKLDTAIYFGVVLLAVVVFLNVAAVCVKAYATRRFGV